MMTPSFSSFMSDVRIRWQCRNRLYIFSNQTLYSYLNLYVSPNPKTSTIPCYRVKCSITVKHKLRLEALLDSGLALECFKFYKKSSPGFARLLKDVKLFAMSKISMQSGLYLLCAQMCYIYLFGVLYIM